MSEIVRAALVQSAWTGDRDSMVDKNVQYAHDAANQDANVICFQEIFSAPYFCIPRRLSISILPKRSLMGRL